MVWRIDQKLSRQRHREFDMGGCFPRGRDWPLPRAAGIRWSGSPGPRHRDHRNCGLSGLSRCVDVPMYLSRWRAGLVEGGEQLGFLEGLHDARTRWIVTHDFAQWKDEIAWMSLYFTAAVWASLALCIVYALGYLPRYRTEPVAAVGLAECARYHSSGTGCSLPAGRAAVSPPDPSTGIGQSHPDGQAGPKTRPTTTSAAQVRADPRPKRGTTASWQASKG